MIQFNKACVIFMLCRIVHVALTAEDGRSVVLDFTGAVVRLGSTRSRDVFTVVAPKQLPVGITESSTSKSVSSPPCIASTTQLPKPPGSPSKFQIVPSGALDQLLETNSRYINGRSK